MPRPAQAGRATASRRGSTPSLPAVTCSVQSTFLTGLEPTDHGIVGNGWYFRDLGEVFLWRQHNQLVQGEKVWETARRAQARLQGRERLLVVRDGRDDRLHRHAAADLPRRRAQGARLLHVTRPTLHDRLTGALGEFPLFTYWGPTASITSSRWIAQASRQAARRGGASTCCSSTCRTSTTTTSASGPGRRESARGGARARRRGGRAGRARARRAATPSSCCRSTGSPTRAGRSTSTARCAAPGCSTSTRRRGWSTSTRGPRAPSRSPTTRSRTSTCRDPADLPAAREALAGLRGHRRGARGRRPTRRRASATSARASSCSSPSPTPGSPTTTGSTTSARPTSRATSRSTASPATTPPSSSSTRPTSWSRRRRARRWCARSSGFRYVDAASSRSTRRCVRGTHGRLPDDRRRRAGAAAAPTRALARDRIAATDVRDLLLELAGAPAALRAP